MRKRFLMVFLPLATLLAVASMGLFYSAQETARAILQERVANIIKARQQHYREQFRSIVSDLLVLSSSHALQLLLETGDEKHRKMLESEFLAFSRYKELYDQIRFLDQSGMEVVRIDFNGGQPATVANDKLQFKGRRYYFLDTFQHGPGEVYVSPFDLNVEQGRVERPLKPVLRFGTPVFDAQGRKRGVVLLNYLGAEMLGALEQSTALAPGRIMLLNPDGYWLKGLDAADEWGFMYPDGADKTFGKRFPEAWQRIKTAEAGQFVIGKGMFTFTTIYPLLAGLRSSSGSGHQTMTPSAGPVSADEYAWKIVSYVTPGLMSAGTRRFQQLLFASNAILLLLFGGGAWRLAWLGILREQKQARLKSEGERFQQAIRGTNDGIWDWDLLTGEIFFSPRWKEMLGYEEHEIGHSFIAWRDQVHPDDLGRFLVAWTDYLDGENESFFLEYRMRTKQGRYLWVRCRGLAINDDAGNPVKLSGVQADISQEKQAGERLKTTLTQTIQAVALTVEKRDPYTAGHQLRVAELAVAIAKHMGFDTDRLEGLYLGGIIHDIGKVYIPAEILNRPGKLTTAQFDLIKTHSQVGFDIMKDVDFPWPVAKIILQHHERMDGSGYPNGLKGDEIILEAKILAVADVMEAITSDRPYRPGLGIEIALEEIERHRGSWYDPESVDICLRLFREKSFDWA